MKKQQFLQKWQNIFIARGTPISIYRDFENDLNLLLNNEDTAQEIVHQLNDYAEGYDHYEYGLPVHEEKYQNKMETIVKNILNNEMD